MLIDHYYDKFMGLDQERAVLRELGKNLASLAETHKAAGRRAPHGMGEDTHHR